MPTVEVGRPEAADAIWKWREPGMDIESDPSSRLRLVGTLQGLAAGAVGALLLLTWSRIMGMFVLTIAGILLLSALVSPTGIYHGIRGVFEVLARVTGRVLTWVMLVPLFYGFFLPFGILMRRDRSDRLKRYFEPKAGTYWEPHESRSKSIERQF